MSTPPPSCAELRIICSWCLVVLLQCCARAAAHRHDVIYLRCSACIARAAAGKLGPRWLAPAGEVA